MNKTPFDYQLEILIKEWDYVQSHIGRFDTIVFGIRGWAVSAFTGLLAVSASQKLPALMLLAALPILLFWIVDALHKSFQRHFILRGREIEKYLASKSFTEDLESQTAVSIRIPALSEKFGKGAFLARSRDVMEHMLLRNVLITYGSILVLCFLSYILLATTVPD